MHQDSPPIIYMVALARFKGDPDPDGSKAFEWCITTFGSPSDQWSSSGMTVYQFSKISDAIFFSIVWD